MKDPTTPSSATFATGLELKRSPKSLCKVHRASIGGVGRSPSSTFLQPRGFFLRRRNLVLFPLAFILVVFTFCALRDSGYLFWRHRSHAEDVATTGARVDGALIDATLDMGIDAKVLEALDSLPGESKKDERQENSLVTKKSKKPKRAKKHKRSESKPQSPPPSPPPLPFNPLEPVLPRSHFCSNFTMPPPPIDPKRSGPRACPVCYLPVEQAASLWPEKGRGSSSPVVKELTFVTEEDEGEQRARALGGRPRFAGHQTLQERADSFHLAENMRVHCGFVWGGEPGALTGFDSSLEDREYMQSCRGVIVASAIFGAYDLVQQPSGISDQSKDSVCFVMFVDQATHRSLLQDGTLQDEGARHVGLWRLVVVTNLPYRDPRRNGKIPKLLAHRLFPNAQFSIWVDAKLELRVDPFLLLERFLWRGNFTWAISRHYARFDVYEEAERNKAAGKYRNASIDAQMEVYRREGMAPFSEDKMPIISDVPEGCVIIRELTPLTNLLACAWFNEVDRYTSRDQLSFGFCRDKVRRAIPGWNLNMFLDCERRNFVVQKYHKDVLRSKFGDASSSVSAGAH